jgi:hypothetical protein
MRIDYDDDTLTVIEKINEELQAFNLAFEAKDDEHGDGFMVFDLVEKDI